MPAKDKSKVNGKDINEELSVQVMLAVYQTDIQTHTALLFGAIAFTVGVWAIWYSVADNPDLMLRLLPIPFVVSVVCVYASRVATRRYQIRRKQLDELRKKYCPEAYKEESITS